MIRIDIRKMSAIVASDGKVSYFLHGAEEAINVNALIGKELNLHFTGKIKCVACGKVTKKSFGQGYCYPCFISSPETEECVLKPHLCQAHVGIARNMEYAANHCLIDHFVYLAISGGLKVGVTRHTQIPTRWIDQGASQGLIVAKTPNRHLAGAIEVDLMKTFSDKTNWRAMLTNNDPDIDLKEKRESLYSTISKEFTQYLNMDFNPIKLAYPVISYPTKVTSMNFDKTADISGVLEGIRGQYLIFGGGKVINLRTFSGYEVELEF